jgi:6-phosphofructokinase
MDHYRNSGGFDMIGSGRHKIEKPKEFADAMANCIALDLDGLVVIGGDDSNTNGAVLAEYFEANGCKTKVRRFYPSLFHNQSLSVTISLCVSVILSVTV